MPELQDGKNVADFIDPDIVARLDELEREEERLEASGFYDDEDDVSLYERSPRNLKLTRHA
jgi:nucleolar GTP-binding protein